MIRDQVAGRGYGDAAAGARKAEVGPDAGTSLTSGYFDTAGHGTRGVRKGSKAQVIGVESHVPRSLR